MLKPDLSTPSFVQAAPSAVLRRMLAALLLAGSAVAALTPATGRAQAAAPAAAEPAASAAPAPRPRMPHGPGMPRHGHPMAPPETAGWMPMHGPGFERLLERVGATPEQRSQIRQIRDAERAELRGEHEAARALHAEGARIFSADTIDVAAAEALRQKMLAHHDKVSHRHLQAMIDIANVLTPAQRRELAQLAAAAPRDAAAGGARPLSRRSQ